MFGTIFNKFSSGRNSITNKPRPFKSIQLGIVQEDGEVQVDSDSITQRARNERFNSDTHAIRVRLIGTDNTEGDTELANCFPLLPKHLNFKPSKGEIVMVVMFGEDEKQGDRFYIGPYISAEDKLGKDTADGGADSNFQTGKLAPSSNFVKRDPNSFGIYENPKHVIIEGRDNTDFIQKSGEILIRSGKFKLNQRRVFNDENPGFIQLKFNQPYKEETLNENGVSDVRSSRTSDDPKYVTVTNIVSDKINLLSHNGDIITDKNGENPVNLTSRIEGETGAAKYITDIDMDTLLNNAHPLVFGDVLLEYLKLLKEALFNHVHNNHGLKSTDNTSDKKKPLAEFKLKASELEKAMISKNIRIN